MSDQVSATAPTGGTQQRSRVNDAVVKTLVALAFSPVGIVAGYLLNDYLSRDRLQIAHVDLHAAMTVPTLPAAAREAVLTSRLADDFRLDATYAVGSAGRLLQESDPLGATEDSQGSLIRYLRRLATYLDSTQVVATEVIGALDDGSAVQPLLARTGRYPSISRAVSVPGPLDPQAVPPIRDAVRGVLDQAVALKPSVEALLSELESFQPERTGELDLRVVVTNLGDTDGLLGASAELELIDSGLVVELSSLQSSGPGASSYLVVDDATPLPVPRRSVAVAMYSSAFSDGRSDALSQLRSLLVAHNAAAVRLILRDTRGEEIRSDRLSLPLPPQPDP